MWKPAERIRHESLPGGWPSAEEAARSLLFLPIALGPARLESRTWVPAMVPWRATDDGFVTDELLAWYERFAQGAPGALVVEATGIRDIPSGPLLRIGDDRFVPGLARLVETVRRASGGRTRLFLQIIDFLSIRRRPEREKFLLRFLKIEERHCEELSLKGKTEDEVRAVLAGLGDEELRGVLSEREWEALTRGLRERVTDTELPWIAELPRVLPGLFAAAAERAERAGFDGVELHFAHAYTMASFLSRRNTRSDGWGGSLQGRVRLPREVVEAVRGRVSNSFAVGARILADEAIEGGSDVADASFFAVELARAAEGRGLDFLSLSRGGKFEDALEPRVGQAVYPYTGPSGWECMPTAIADSRGPFGRNVQASFSIRSALRSAGFSTPVVAVGGIHSFAQAEAILARGEADLVGAARQSLADPDWWEKVRVGRGAEVRRCDYTNYCEALDQMHKPVSCRLWDKQGLDEPGVLLSPDGKRRLVAPAWERERVPPTE